MIYDTETYSSEPIKSGLDRYFSAPDFRLLCLAYGETPEDVKLETTPEQIRETVYRLFYNSELYAHNANFDRRATGLGHTRCTQTQALANGCPGKLDYLTKFLDTPHKKNPDGVRLISRCCVPGGSPSPEDYEKLGRYCQDDVRATLAAVARLRGLTQQEWEQYWVSEAINARGMHIDLELCRAAVQLRDIEEEEVSKEVRLATGLAARSIKMINYIKCRLPDHLHHYLWDVEASRYSLNTQVRERLLEEPEVPVDVHELLFQIDCVRSTSASKYAKLLDQVDWPGSSGNLTGAYVFSGARVTGRFSSKGVQMHNLPRPDKGFDPEVAREQVLRGTVQGSLSKTLRSLLRSAITARPGNVLVWGDEAAIEARVIQYLASPDDDTELLRGFRAGADPYVVTAHALGADRSVGKVTVLACGFQGGVNALARMCKAYGVALTEAQKIAAVEGWRRANPEVVKLWRHLDDAAINAVMQPGTVQQVGVLNFYVPPVLHDRLLLRLPSGRMQTYWDPRLEESEYGLKVTVKNASLLPAAGKPEWPRRDMYGGLWAENATQGFAACVLREALTRCEDAGMFTVGHTHDEILTECENVTEVVEATKFKLARCLTAPVEWAPRLPLGCEIMVGERYRK